MDWGYYLLQLDYRSICSIIFDMWVRTDNIIPLIFLLAVIILLLLYLLTLKNCEDLTKLIQILCQTKNFSDLFNQQSRARRHPSQLNGENYRVRHILCRRTPPTPKLDLTLIDSVVMNFLWISGRSPSREQQYYGLMELEVNFLKILQTLLGTNVLRILQVNTFLIYFMEMWEALKEIV